MDKFISLFIINLTMIIAGIATYFSEPNYFIGLRTTDTLSDERVWYKANKFSGKLFIIFGIVMLFITILFAVFKLTDFIIYLVYVNLNVLLGLAIISGVYAHIYAKRLKSGEREKPLILNKSFNYILISLCIIFIIIGLVLPFTKPNPYIGVRIPRTFESLARWKLINTIAGISIAIFGAIFTYIFYKPLNKDEKERKIYIKSSSPFSYHTNNNYYFYNFSFIFSLIIPLLSDKIFINGR
ncbi:MAG: SdpI family protein [Caldisericia bacterium]